MKLGDHSKLEAGEVSQTKGLGIKTSPTGPQGLHTKPNTSEPKDQRAHHHKEGGVGSCRDG